MVQLREGGFYRNRDGNVCGPMEVRVPDDRGDPYAFRDKDGVTFTANGSYVAGDTSQYDLVEEVSRPNSTEDAFESCGSLAHDLVAAAAIDGNHTHTGAAPDAKEDTGPAWLPRQLTVGIWWEGFGLLIADVEVTQTGVGILSSYVEADDKSIDIPPLALDNNALKRASGKFVTLRELIEARAREEAWA